MKSKVRNPKTKFGFTLIELIVVIIIMAVLSAVAVPSYTRLRDRSKFDGSVQEIITLYRWARDAAVESGLETTVRFDHQSGAFIAISEEPEVMADMPTALLEQREREQQHAAPPPRVYELEDELAVSDFQSYRPEDSFAAFGGNEAASTIRFRHDGSCDGGRLMLVAASGYRAVIEIAAATGKPSIIEETD